MGLTNTYTDAEVIREANDRYGVSVTRQDLKALCDCGVIAPGFNGTQSTYDDHDVGLIADAMRGYPVTTNMIQR